MAAAPDTSVATQLAAGGLGLVLGDNLVVGKLRAPGGGFAVEAVAVAANGGGAPLPYQGGGAELQRTALQVMVRSEPRDYEAGQVLARGVRDAIHHVVPAGFVELRVLEAEPIYLGEDADGAHLWTMNVEAIHEE